MVSQQPLLQRQQQPMQVAASTWLTAPRCAAWLLSSRRSHTLGHSCQKQQQQPWQPHRQGLVRTIPAAWESNR